MNIPKLSVDDFNENLKNRKNLESAKELEQSEHHLDDPCIIAVKRSKPLEDRTFKRLDNNILNVFAKASTRFSSSREEPSERIPCLDFDQIKKFSDDIKK